MKRIAFISDHASPLTTMGVDAGGQEVYVAEVTRQLARKGYEVDIFTRWEDPSLDQVINWIPGVRVIQVPAGRIEYMRQENLFPFMNEFTQNMIKFIGDENVSYDLVHANFWMSALVAFELKKMFQIPYVISFHELGHVRKLHQKDDGKFPPERVLIEEETAKFAEQVIAECPQDEEDLIQYYNVSPSKITIIPRGFNPAHFYPVNCSFARRILELKPDESIILQLGRMAPCSGVDNVIRSMALLKNSLYKIKLLIVGGESGNPHPEKCGEIERLQQIVKEEDIGDMVKFAGRQNRDMLKYYYSAADMFVTTPWYEPFGITTVESMACGTPVLGANVGGIKYSVKDNETGFLIPPNDPEALAEKIKLLLSKPSILYKMKMNALERVNSLFTWSIVSSTMAEMYESVLSSCRKTMDSIVTPGQLAPVINLEKDKTKVRKLTS